MKKLKLFSILTILSITTTFGQTDCDKLKSENQELNSELTKKKEIVLIQSESISKLESEVKYLKETLNLLNTKTIKESENIIYRINSVKGNSDEGIIIIEGLVENKGAVGKFQTAGVELIDPKGNQYKTFKTIFGETSYIPKFQRNLPTKFTIKFDKIVDETPVIKAFIFNFYGKKSNVIFKNLPVTWK